MEKSEKNKIRSWVREQRNALDYETEQCWNESICNQLLQIEQVYRSFCVYCYASFRHEAGTWRFIESLLKQGKYVALPRISGKTMEFYSISGKADLQEGAMGIMEPKPACIKISDPDAPVIVPGVGFDKEGNRIGYGGGFYDRFFEREPSHPRLAIAYQFQIFDRIPSELHDKKMDQIITPQKRMEGLNL